MKFPFVSRSIYEDVRKMLEERTERLDYLTDLLADMKVSGATLQRLTSAAGGTAKLETKPKSAIQQAIDESEHASKNLRLRTHLAKWAERELERGQDEEKVLNRLRTWHQPSEDDDDDDDETDTVPIG